MSPATVLSVNNLTKQFQLHLQHNTHIDVFANLSLQLNMGQCLVLNGPSGIGKSSLLKCIYGNYKPAAGQIFIHFADNPVDLTQSSAQLIHAVRQNTLSYVSQFLRVLPRVPALDVVAQPLIDDGCTPSHAKQQAGDLLARLNIPKRLWPLSPTSFSGGEQQRVNIARSFIKFYPIMLLDEPTASLDDKNKAVVIEIIQEAKARGSAMLGIFHDEATRKQVADAYLNMADYIPKQLA